LVEVRPEKLEAAARKALELGLQVEKIGEIGGDTVHINDVSLSLETLKNIYFNRFAEVIEQDL
jgi:phosphoribosylformylglycinamidine synthase